MKILSGYNVAVGSIITVLSAVFGQFWYIFVAFLLLNIIDYVTGYMKSKVFGKLSSVEGLKGIVKKLGYWVAIAVAFLVSVTLTELLQDTLGINAEFLMLFGWFTVACFLINEARSVLENLVEMGINVPEFLIKGLAVTQKMIEDGASSKVPNGEGSEVNGN